MMEDGSMANNFGKGKESYRPIGPEMDQPITNESGFLDIVRFGGGGGDDVGNSMLADTGGQSRGLSQSGASAIGQGVQLAGDIGISIAQSQSDKALQEQSQMLAGLAEEQQASQQDIQNKFAESSMALKEKAFDIQKMQTTFANRMKKLQKELAGSLKKKSQLKGLGMSMKDKMSQDEQYKDVMINSFRSGGEQA